MDYEHLNLEHFFARNHDLSHIRDNADFVMINNIAKYMNYRNDDEEGSIDLKHYNYKNRSAAMSFIFMNYKAY